MLFNGEEVGNGDGPECDFAVDPVDGTTLMSKGMPNAISVLAVAERGAMFDPSAVFYMNKIAVGPDAADVIDITAPIAENIRAVAKVKRTVGVADITVCILDRPRHNELIAGRPRGRRADPADHRRRRRGRHLRLPARTPAPTCWSASAAPRRASSPRPRSAAWAAPSRRRLAPTDDAERQKALDAGPRFGAGPDHRGPGLRRQRVLLRDRGHRRRPAAGVRYSAADAPRSRS